MISPAPKSRRYGPLLRRRLLFAGQAALSTALLAYVFLKVDLADAATTASRADLVILIASLVQLALQFPLVALRWKIIAAALSGELPFAAALRYVWIGSFFSQILPGSIGGDAARMWLYWIRCRSPRIAVYSVAFERLVMVVTLLLFVLAVQPSLVGRGAPVGVVFAAIGLLIGIATILALLLFSGRLLSTYAKWRPVRALTYASADLLILFASLPRSAALFVLSLLSYLNMAVVMWMIARALGLDVLLADCMVFAPLIVLAATLPLSVGGWGVREGATIVLFGLAGVPESDALVLSLVFGICTVLVTLPGAPLWLLRERGVKVAQIELDLPSVR